MLPNLNAGLQYLNSEIEMEKYSARSLSPSVVGDCFNMKWQPLEVALANVHGYDSGQLSTKIYDKRDDFNFKIINFPNMCSNIPASPAYGVYISQLVRYARASSNYSDFLKRHLHLRNRLLDQGYKKIRLIRSLKKFIFRYQYLVEIYSVSAEKIISDAFSYSENV